jgi:hypothetical protein
MVMRVEGGSHRIHSRDINANGVHKMAENETIPVPGRTVPYRVVLSLSAG